MQFDAQIAEYLHFANLFECAELLAPAIDDAASVRTMLCLLRGVWSFVDTMERQMQVGISSP